MCWLGVARQGDGCHLRLGLRATGYWLVVIVTGELMRSECSKAARSDACRTMGVRIRTAVRLATLTSAYSRRPQKTKMRHAIIQTSIALMYDTCMHRRHHHHHHIHVTIG